MGISEELGTEWKPEPAKSENDGAYGCLGIVAIVAVVWLLFAACSGGSSSSSSSSGNKSVSEHLASMGLSSAIANSPSAPSLMADMCSGLDRGMSDYQIVEIGQSAGVSITDASKILAVAKVRNCPEYL